MRSAVGAVDEPLVEALADTRGRATRGRRASRSAASGWSIIMKSMNSGTPASVALPERSSFGMMMSTSTRTVAYSCAVKNFGLKAAAVRAAACARLRVLVPPARLRPRVQAKPAATGADADAAAAASRRLIVVITASPSSAPRRCTRLVRIASARIVHVQFLSALRDERPAVGDEQVLHVVRLAVRCSAPTCVGSLPIRVTPSSWMMRPPGSRP